MVQPEEKAGGQGGHLLQESQDLHSGACVAVPSQAALITVIITDILTTKSLF